jgi:DNA-binding response OmpR family regulator
VGTILIIDDDDQLREVLNLLLARAGYTVFEAPNGKVGLQLMLSENVDLVITDLYMPEKEGLETIAELRKDFPQTKIIVISGGYKGSVVSHLTLAKELGADRVFEKPFNIDEMFAAIVELLE